MRFAPINPILLLIFTIFFAIILTLIFVVFRYDNYRLFNAESCDIPPPPIIACELRDIFIQRGALARVLTSLCARRIFAS